MACSTTATWSSDRFNACLELLKAICRMFDAYRLPIAKVSIRVL